MLCTVNDAPGQNTINEKQCQCKRIGIAPTVAVINSHFPQYDLSDKKAPLYRLPRCPNRTSRASTATFHPLASHLSRRTPPIALRQLNSSLFSLFSTTNLQPGK